MCCNFAKKYLKQIINKILLVLFIAAQVYFVVAIIREQTLKPWFIIVFSLIVLGMAMSYRKKQYLHIELKHEVHYDLFVWFLIGSFVTYFLQSEAELNTVFAAGLVGFVGSFTRNIKNKVKSAAHWPIAIYCGAFVGMTKLPYGYLFIFLSTVLTAIFYNFSHHYFHGIGGKLGTLAFMGVLYAYIIYKFFLPW